MTTPTDHYNNGWTDGQTELRDQLQDILNTIDQHLAQGPDQLEMMTLYARALDAIHHLTHPTP